MRTNYNTNLPGFIIDVNHRIPEDSLVRKIDTVINQVPDEFFNKADRKVGRIGYPSRLMLKIILLAYAKNVFSGREIEKLLNTDLEMIWISQDTHMTYKTINNFRSNRWVSKLIENLSEWLNNFLENKGSVKMDTAYIDGTIIAADTYKYGFVWKKSAKKFLEKLYLKIASAAGFLTGIGIICPFNIEKEPSPSEIVELIIRIKDKLSEIEKRIDEEPEHIKGGSQNKKIRRILKKYCRLLETNYLPRLKNYLYEIDIAGDRGSYAKTDHDATFMHTKDDPMKNGQTKPAYNLQIATNNGYAIAFELFQRPTDAKTLVPFIEHHDILKKMKNLVTDAGYGSEENYEKISKMGIVPLLEYGTYQKEQTKKYIEDPSKRHNWLYNVEKDEYVDNNGVVFKYVYTQEQKQSGYSKTVRIYQASEYPEDDIRHPYSYTSKGYIRKISVNQTFEEWKNNIKDLLSHPYYRLLFAQRKIEDEPVFGVMKKDKGFIRLHVKGLRKSTTEIGIVLLVQNLQKFFNSTTMDNLKI